MKRPLPDGWTDYSSELRIDRNPLLRWLFRALGIIAVALGTLGYVLPGLPGTVFILIAAYFFARSSPRFYNMLLNHRLLGPMIRDYRAGKGVPRWVKIYASLMIVGFAGSSAALLALSRGRPVIAAIVVLLGLYGLHTVLRLPTRATLR